MLVVKIITRIKTIKPVVINTLLRRKNYFKNVNFYLRF